MEINTSLSVPLIFADYKPKPELERTLQYHDYHRSIETRNLYKEII